MTQLKLVQPKPITRIGSRIIRVRRISMKQFNELTKRGYLVVLV